MATMLRHLCKYATENYGMRLICGEENMNNLVNWVHMLEDPETASFLHGQELIFSTGIGYSNTDWLVEFAKGLVEHQASGLILNIGPYIQSVPEELISYCEDLQFPLFTMPWKTRIVDITNDFCRKIIKAEENEVTVAGAFRDAIFYPEKTTEYRSVLERKEFDLNAEFCIIAISLQVNFNDKLLEYDKRIRNNLTKILLNINDRFSLFRQDKYLIAVLQSFSRNEVENSINSLIINYGKEETIRVGISVNDSTVYSLSRSYKRAIAALHLAEKQKKVQMYYEDIGLYQLILEVEDPKVLERFYTDTLGQLEDFDTKNGTDYLDTLKSYLTHNSSVQEVAKETYVHRNTVNYKIKKIKEILQCDLDYQDGLKIILAFHIKELL